MTERMRNLLWLVLLAALASACDDKPSPSALTPTSSAAPPATAAAASAAATASAAPRPDSATGAVSEEDFKALHLLRQDQAPAPRGEKVKLGSSGAYLSLPQGAEPPFPALVVIHEWWGLNQHIRHWTDRLAADGYAALAVDLYGGQVADNVDDAMTLMKAIDDARARTILGEALRFLAEDPRIKAQRRGSIGWCLGGKWSLELALDSPELDAAVVYYGHVEANPTRLAALQAPLLAVFGDRDESIPPKAVNRFEFGLEQAGGKSYQLLRYDAQHAFANPSSGRYDEKAAAAAWEKVRAFLRDKLIERD